MKKSYRDRLWRIEFWKKKWKHIQSVNNKLYNTAGSNLVVSLQALSAQVGTQGPSPSWLTVVHIRQFIKYYTWYVPSRPSCMFGKKDSWSRSTGIYPAVSSACFHCCWWPSRSTLRMNTVAWDLSPYWRRDLAPSVSLSCFEQPLKFPRIPTCRAIVCLWDSRREMLQRKGGDWIISSERQTS